MQVLKRSNYVAAIGLFVMLSPWSTPGAHAAEKSSNAKLQVAVHVKRARVSSFAIIRPQPSDHMSRPNPRTTREFKTRQLMVWKLGSSTSGAAKPPRRNAVSSGQPPAIGRRVEPSVGYGYRAGSDDPGVSRRSIAW